MYFFLNVIEIVAIFRARGWGQLGVQATAKQKLSFNNVEKVRANWIFCESSKTSESFDESNSIKEILRLKAMSDGQTNPKCEQEKHFLFGRRKATRKYETRKMDEVLSGKTTKNNFYDLKPDVPFLPASTSVVNYSISLFSSMPSIRRRLKTSPI